MVFALSLWAWLLFMPGGVLPPVQAQAATGTITLEEAYREALQSHEQIRIADREVAKSLLLRQKANSIMLPHAILEGQYNRLDDAVTRSTVTHISAPPLIDRDILVGPVETTPREQYGGSVSIQQNIYRPEYFPLRGAAAYKREQSREALLDTTQTILFEVATAYYDAVSAGALVASAEEVLALAKKNEEIAAVKFDAGNVTEDAVHWARLNRTRAEGELITARHGLVLAREILARMVGREEPPENVVQPEPLFPRKEDREVLLQFALANRHDYRAATLGVKLAEQDVKLARSKFLPSVGAEWKQYWLNEQTYSVDSQFWTAGVRITFPLYEGGLRTADLDEKEETLEEARLAVANLEKNIRLEVEQARLTTVTMASVLANAHQQVETASVNYEIVGAKFFNGAATSLDLDQALTALDTAKTQLVKQTYDEQKAILQVERAIGLFDPTRTPAGPPTAQPGGAPVTESFVAAADTSDVLPPATVSGANATVEEATASSVPEEGQARPQGRGDADLPGRYPEASLRPLGEEDLAGMTGSELRILRNEIFARHGYIFSNPEVAEYFNGQPWYSPRSRDVYAQLRPVERDNLAFVKAHDERLP
ncbi:MAG: TolC family protein [Thermodesulfobacteriota bacterium]